MKEKSIYEKQIRKEFGKYRKVCQILIFLMSVALGSLFTPYKLMTTIGGFVIFLILDELLNRAIKELLKLICQILKYALSLPTTDTFGEELKMAVEEFLKVYDTEEESRD